MKLYTHPNTNPPELELLRQFGELYGKAEKGAARARAILKQEAADFTPVAMDEQAILLDLGYIEEVREKRTPEYGQGQEWIAQHVKQNPGIRDVPLCAAYWAYWHKDVPSIDKLDTRLFLYRNPRSRIQDCLEKGMIIKKGKGFYPPEAVDVSPAAPDSQGAPVAAIERSVRYILANGGKVRRNGAENIVIFEHGGEKCSVPLAQAEQTKWMEGGAK